MSAGKILFCILRNCNTIMIVPGKEVIDVILIERVCELSSSIVLQRVLSLLKFMV